MFRQKKRYLIYILSLPAIVVLLIIVLAKQVEETTSQIRPTTDQNAVNLGLVYVPVNPAISSDYQINVSTGAFITEVVPNSLADKAGLKPGDVVVSFNNTGVDKEKPLFGMLRRCPPGKAIEVEIIRGNNSLTIQIPCPTK